MKQPWTVRRIRSLLVLLLAALAVLADFGAPANASNLAMAYVDPRGDGNGSNGQGERGVELGVSTEPASVPEADILRVAFGQLVMADRVTGFSVTFTLAGAVSDEYVYALKAYVTLRCGITLTFRPPITEVFGHCRDDRVHLPDAVVQGSTLTIVVPLDLLPRGIHPGDTLGPIDAYTFRLVSIADQAPFEVPKLDYASTSKTYVIPG